MTVNTPQDNWAKACVAAAGFIMRTGERGIRLIEEMERIGEGKITGTTFRVMEGIADPEDYDNVLTDMDPGLGKPTVPRLRQVVQNVLQRRWWTWCLLHPGLTNSHIHATRRVCPSLCSHLFCCMSCIKCLVKAIK